MTTGCRPRRGVRVAVLILCVSAIAGCAPNAHDQGPSVAAIEPGARVGAREAELRPDQPIDAAMFRYQQRLSEDGTIPDNAIIRAKRQRDDLIDPLGIDGGVTPESWQWLGPGNIGGRIRPIVIHPGDPDIMWIGSASGGIWKTTDGGADWQPLDDFMASLAVADLVMHPEDPNVLFAGTGEGFFETIEGTSNTAAVRGAGIFQTTDGGAMWTQLPATANENFYFVNRISIHPTNPDKMVVATTTGIWRTIDAGKTWTRRATFNALDVRRNPNVPRKLVAGGHHETNGPWFSTNDGRSWQQASGAGGERQELAYAPSDPDIVYAAVSENFRIRVWRSTDGGQTYTLMTQGSGMQTWASYNSTIWVDPTNANFLVVGGVRLFVSTNGGVSFLQRFGAVHPDMHRIVEHPGFDGVNNKTVFFATDGGIWRTTDVRGSSAIDLNNNLGITQFYGAAINPTTGGVAGGTQDNGSLSFQGDPQAWVHYFGGDGGYAAADPTDPNIFYGEVQVARIHRSDNGGQSARYIYNTQNPIQDAGTNNCNFIPFFMLDPNDENTMLVACGRLWRSNNVKATSPDWFIIKGSLGPLDPPGDPGDPGQAHFAPNDPRNISTIAIAEGNADIVWVGHNNGQVWFTTNGTAQNPTWTRVDENGAGLPDRWVSTIVIDPNNHDHVYIAFMGWEADNLWKSEDSGQTWQQATGSGDAKLPSAPASALAVHRIRPGVLYVGGDIGMFVSDDDGQTWSTETDGPGTVPVEQLIWKDNNTLMAVTHGRGIFLAEVRLPVVFDSLQVPHGTIVSGGIEDIRESDDAHLQIQSEFHFDVREANRLEVRLSGDVDRESPVSLDITFEGRLDNPDGIVSIRLRNWNTGEFDQVHQFALHMNEIVETIEGIDPTNYIRAGDGRIEVSVKQVVVAPFTASGFRSFIDQVKVVAH